MSKLVDKERLAKLAKALDQRAKAAVQAEKERAMAVEQAIEAKADGNTAAINAINHEETGILAQAKGYADTEIGKAKQEAVEGDNALDARIQVLEGKVNGEGEGTLDDVIEGVAANKQAIETLNGGVGVQGSVAKSIADAITPVQGEIDAAEGRLDAVEGRLDQLDIDQGTQNEAIEAAQAAADQAQREVDAAEQRLDAIDEAQEAQDGRLEAAEGRLDGIDKAQEVQDGRLDAVEQAIGTLNAAKTVEGSVDYKVDQVVTPVVEAVDELAAELEAKVGELQQADADNLQAAKDYADQQITALVNGAPEAMNTLKELADEIEAHQGVYEAYVAQVSGALDKKVDKVEGSRLVSETEIAGWNAKAEVSQVNQALQDAKDYTDAREVVVQEQINTIKGEQTTQDGRLDALEASVNGETGLAKMKEDIVKAQAAADQAQAEVDAAEGRLDAIEAEQDVQDGKISTNEAAIAKLNGGADVEGSVAHSIEEALEVYSTTDEMKAILGNVVNSLALSIEDNKIMLKLGSAADGITIHETSLDMATDADIQAIIDGLDA